MRYNNKILLDTSKKNEKRKTLIICVAVIIGLLCIIISTFISSPWNQYDNYRIMINTVLSTIATVAFASIAWEAWCKYAFSRDIIDMVGISDNLAKSGVFAIENSFYDIAWNELLVGRKSITVVISYSTKWGQSNQELIKEAIKAGCVLTVALPDTNNSKLIEALSYRFEGVENIKERIHDAEKYYQSLGAKITYYQKSLQTSFYLIDEIGILVPFNHQAAHGGHAPSVPAFISHKPGFIYDYVEREVSAIVGRMT